MRDEKSSLETHFLRDNWKFTFHQEIAYYPMHSHLFRRQIHLHFHL